MQEQFRKAEEVEARSANRNGKNYQRSRVHFYGCIANSHAFIPTIVVEGPQTSLW